MSQDGTQVDATRAPPAQGAEFYRYTEAGRVVVVDTLSRVPARLRSSVEVVRVERPSSPSMQELRELPQRVHWPSFIAGAGTALILVLAVLAAQRRFHGVLRWVFVAGVLALAAGAYFGWLRRMGGQSEQLLSSPQSLIDDARATVQRMNERSKEQERVLRELDAER
jgi:hypothetical protein